MNSKKLLSEEWNKPKASNLKKNDKGEIIDTREPRDYDKIKKYQDDINSSK